MTEINREDYLNKQRERLQGRIAEIFQEWKSNPVDFAFCQPVRSVEMVSVSGGREFALDDGSAMMDAIAQKACGDHWEYDVKSTVGGDPVCVLTLYVGDRND